MIVSRRHAGGGDEPARAWRIGLDTWGINTEQQRQQHGHAFFDQANGMGKGMLSGSGSGMCLSLRLEQL